MTTCNKFEIDPEYEEEAVVVAFNKAKQAAADIMASPGDYMTHQFRKAIENLEAAYQAVQDFATGIASIQSSTFKTQTEAYDLNGRKVANVKNLPRGIYIIGGRKVLVK